MTTPSEALSLAFQYIIEASESIEEAAASDAQAPTGHPGKTALFLSGRTGLRQQLRERIEAARELLAVLEEECPDATAAVTLESGEEIIMTVPLARMLCYRTEANVMFHCYDDLEAARSLMEHAIAIDPSDSVDHAMHGALCSALKDFPAAFASMERAISLEPDNLEYKRMLNDFRREKERFEAEKAMHPKRSKWNPKSWLT